MSQNAKKNISRSMETENEDLVSIRYQPFYWMCDLNLKHLFWNEISPFVFLIVIYDFLEQSIKLKIMFIFPTDREKEKENRNRKREKGRGKYVEKERVKERER